MEDWESLLLVNKLLGTPPDDACAEKASMPTAMPSYVDNVHDVISRQFLSKFTTAALYKSCRMPMFRTKLSEQLQLQDSLRTRPWRT